MTNEKLKIPEDLKAQYDMHLEWRAKNMFWPGCGIGTVEGILRADAVELIERIARLEAENAALKAQLAALQWREIDAKNLPKVGDEVLYTDGSVLAVNDDGDIAEEWAMTVEDGWTHYRSINSPQPKEAAK